MNEVIVFGKDRYNTLGLVRSLGRKGIPVFLLLKHSSPISYCRLSKYVTRTKQVNTVEEGVQYLINSYKVHSGEKTIIIPTSDSVASEMDLHYDALSPKFMFPNAGNAGSLTAIMDKALMTSIAKDAGLSTPMTIEYTCGDALPEHIPFPCLIKPAKSIEGTKSQIKICYNLNEIESAVSALKNRQHILIQQLINKEYDILLLGCRCPNGKVFLSGVFKKERWVSVGEDGSFGLITTDYSQWFNKGVVEQFLSKLNYVGPFSIECGVEKGIPYFYEINLRNDGTSHYFDLTGFCTPYAWVMECTGNKVDYSSKGEYYFIDEFEDFVNVAAGNCTFKEWRRDKKRASVFKYKCSDDRKPMLVIFPYMVARTIKTIVKTRRI